MIIDKLQKGITLVNADNLEYMATIPDKYFDWWFDVKRYRVPHEAQKAHNN